MERTTGFSFGANKRKIICNNDVEMRAIWYPIITVRNEKDIRKALKITQPFTVVYDTEEPHG